MENVGSLYIVATPIGNLDDISRRALNILQQVDFVAAEDTRHSRKLLSAYHIDTPMVALHEHNEASRAASLLDRIVAGENAALVSDAGTPLISDPGYALVNQARQRGIAVVPVPGARAAITALCASGLPTDRFLFVGFLPQKEVARRQVVNELLQQTVTVICYESPRRILNFLQLMDELAPERGLCLAKELTKTFERYLVGTAAELLAVLQEDASLQKGEWVVMVAGAGPKVAVDIGGDVLAAVELAAESLPLKMACELVAKITGFKKNQLYQATLQARGTK